MEIAVCESDDSQRRLLCELITESLSAKSVQFSCVQFSDDLHLLEEIEYGRHFDALFLELDTSKPCGLTVAENLRNGGFWGDIFFCANTPDLAVEGYRVNVAGYIVKPISYDKIKVALDSRLGSYRADYYVLKQKARGVYLPKNQIVYIESRNTKCNVFCADGKSYSVYKQLRLLEKELGDKRFLRCHQSYLVNMNYIREADDVFVLQDGTEILIRQKDKRIMHSKVFDYLTNHRQSSSFVE